MTDEVPMDSEQLIRRQKFWLCAEVWTDVFTPLSRQQLVRSIQPVHRRFKAICDKYVPSIHLIYNAEIFFDDLTRFEPIACYQYEHLKGNDCKLAKQFQLKNFGVNIWKSPPYLDQIEFERRRRLQKSEMRHCMDLFQGCRVYMSISGQNSISPVDAHEYLACLTILKSAEPAYIELTSIARFPYLRHIPSLQMDELFREPTILHCTQLRLTRTQVAIDEPSVMAIYEWLHHCSEEAEMTEPAMKEEENNVNNMKMKEQGENLEQYKAFREVRCLYILDQNINNIEELQYRCVQHLHQSQWPRDRRPFLFNFRHKQTLPEFQVENEGTGELIRLENVKTHRGHQTTNYCLFRCLAEEVEEKNGKKFYEKHFHYHGIGLFPKLGPPVYIK